jgi:hypothetical protein
LSPALTTQTWNKITMCKLPNDSLFDLSDAVSVVAPSTTRRNPPPIPVRALVAKSVVTGARMILNIEVR